MTVSARRLANAVWRTGELPAELPPCMNKPVRCTGGGTVGKIMDVVLDDSSGTILFCVVSFGSMPHFGDDCRVVPFDVVQLDFENRACCRDPRSGDASRRTDLPARTRGYG